MVALKSSSRIDHCRPHEADSSWATRSVVIKNAKGSKRPNAANAIGGVWSSVKTKWEKSEVFGKKKTNLSSLNSLLQPYKSTTARCRLQYKLYLGCVYWETRPNRLSSPISICRNEAEPSDATGIRAHFAVTACT